MEIEELPQRVAELRLVQQIQLVIDEHGAEAVGWDGDRPEQSTYLHDPAVLLVRQGEEGAVVDAVRATGEYEDDWVDATPIVTPDGQGLPLGRLPVPARLDGDPRRAHRALDAVDAAGLNDEVQVAAPEHWIHLALGGAGKLCPATEPKPATPEHAWPVALTDPAIGKNATVVVVDSGWHPPAGDPNGPTGWLAGVSGQDEHNLPGQVLQPYAGHGTFIAGIVRCLAPGATVVVKRFFTGGSLREVDMVLGLIGALAEEPDLINLSAGCTTRKGRPLLSFEVFHELFIGDRDDLLLVAAAGNDSSSESFWPASFDWVVGVGSLDRDLALSSFTQDGDSADVYTVGAGHVNAYPDGTYQCREVPHAGQLRSFGHGLARWSGTSFAAPVVVGMVAAAMPSAGQAKPTYDSLLLNAGTVASRDGTSHPAFFPEHFPGHT